MAAATLLTLATFASLSSPAIAIGKPSYSKTSLAQLALGKVLDDAAPIFGVGDYVKFNTSTWMSKYPDSTLLVHMNIPGTHDAATWNYSLATQQSLRHVTDLVQDKEYDPSFYRCQDSSIVNMLDAGIRAFDLRYAYDVTNTTLVFWHGPGLQSETATVDDVLFGFYHWLDEHSSEAIFLSFQYEGSTTAYASQDAGVQLQLFNALSSPAARKYFLQATGVLGTLGETRGKIVLLKRFDLDMLPVSYTQALPGLHLSPANWTDNSPNITLVYNTTSGATAYIEDYYQPLTPQGSSAIENIQWKLNATEAHLVMAANTHADSLFWTFCSSTNIPNSPPDTPVIQALGNGTLTPSGGVNQQLVPFLKGLHGKRLGIVMFDFYEKPEELLPLFLSLLPSSMANSYA